MQFCYVGTKVYYSFKRKSGKPVLVFLHGWGASSNCFHNLANLKNNFSILEIDFPPFGKSKEPKDWNVFSYANMVISLCDHLGIEKAHFLGHSFGGRVACLVSVIEKSIVDKLILVDSAGMKTRRKISYYFKLTKLRLMRFFGFDTSNMGSLDYRNLSQNMKKTFSSIVTTNLEEYVKLIESQTLIIFGENDKETPVYMAKKLKKLIPKSKLVIMKGCGHFCFLDKPFEFCKITNEFLRGEM